MNNPITQHYYEGQARELARPREGKINYIPLKPLSKGWQYWLGIWIEVLCIFIALPMLAYWVVEVLIN